VAQDEHRCFDQGLRDQGPRDQGPRDQGPANSAGWFTGLEGVEFYSSCEAPWISVDPCGTIDGQPFYGFYDGCNWCACGENGQFGCTLRLCPDEDAGVPEGDAGVVDPHAWNPSLCTIHYYGVSLAPGGSEEWICDDEGRLFRSACLPAGVSAAP
jgi:hypothetical protein